MESTKCAHLNESYRAVQTLGFIYSVSYHINLIFQGVTAVIISCFDVSSL